MDYRMARKILGEDFIPPSEISKHVPFKIGLYTKESREWLKGRQISRSAMEWCQDNRYMLIAGPWHISDNTTLLTLSSGARDCFVPERPVSSVGFGIPQPFFTDETIALDWLMIRNNFFPGSQKLDWKTQEKMPSIVEMVPNAATVAWAILVLRLVRNLTLLPNAWARTSSVAEDGRRVCIGAQPDGKIRFKLLDDDGRHQNLGILTSRL